MNLNNAPYWQVFLLIIRPDGRLAMRPPNPLNPPPWTRFSVRGLPTFRSESLRLKIAFYRFASSQFANYQCPPQLATLLVWWWLNTNSDVIKTFFQDRDQDQDINFKTKTKPSVQDLFVMYTRGRPKSIFHFRP